MILRTHKPMKTLRTLKNLACYPVAIATSLTLLTACDQASQEMKEAESKVESSVQKAAGSVSGIKLAEPAVANPFKEAVRYLDLGGELFFYLSTEQLLGGMSDRLKKAAEEFSAVDGESIDPEAREEARKITTQIAEALERSGIQDIGAFGFSSLQVEEDLTRTQSILYHQKGEGEGTLWNLFGEAPHELAVLQMAPVNTAYGFSFNFSASTLYQAIMTELKNLEIQEALEEMENLEAEFEQNIGTPLPKLLESLNDELGLLLTLDPSNMVELPNMQGRQIPEPALIILLATKDDLLWKTILKSGAPEPTEAEGYQYVSLPMPPMADYLKPVLAQLDSGYLVLASTQPFLEKVLSVKKGDSPNLTSHEEFKSLSQGIDLKGNSFGYISSEFGALLNDFQDDFSGNMQYDNPYLTETVMLVQKMQTQLAQFGVGSVTDEGFHWVTQSRGMGPNSPDGLDNTLARAIVGGIFGAMQEMESKKKTGEAMDADEPVSSPSASPATSASPAGEDASE